MKERLFFSAIPALLWQVVFFYIPLVVIVVVSVLKRLDYAIWDNVTLQNYAALLDFASYKILSRSVALAFFTALFCFMIAYPIAYFLVFRIYRLRNLLLFFLVLPFWANFLVQVYAWFFVLERGGVFNTALLKIGIISEPLRILNTPFAIYLVMLFCYLPFMVMPIYSSLEKIDRNVIEASLDLGSTNWQTLSRIIIPLSSSGIRTGFFLVFIPSFGEFVVPLLLGGGRQMYAGSLMTYLFLETRSFLQGAAFTCLSGAVLIICVVLLNWLLKKVFGRERV